MIKDKSLEYNEYYQEDYHWNVLYKNKKGVLISIAGMELLIPLEDFYEDYFRLYYDWQYQLYSQCDNHWYEGDMIANFIEEISNNDFKEK